MFQINYHRDNHAILASMVIPLMVKRKNCELKICTVSQRDEK